MSRSASLLLRRLDVWRADEMAPSATAVASGHAALDAALPGGGWPSGALIDLALEDAHTPWSALLLPALARQTQASHGLVAWIEPPWEPGLPALAAGGLRPDHMLWLRARTAAERLWLAEQALGCAGVAAVLAWLPGARATDLRRLHRAAARRSAVLFFAFRSAQPLAGGAACAPLSLALSLAWSAGGAAPAWAVPRLRLDIRRRRGPPALAPIWLPAWNPLLAAVLQESSAAPAATQTLAPVVPLRPAKTVKTAKQGRRHALDRLALAG